MKNFERKKPV